MTGWQGRRGGTILMSAGGGIAGVACALAVKEDAPPIARKRKRARLAKAAPRILSTLNHPHGTTFTAGSLHSPGSGAAPLARIRTHVFEPGRLAVCGTPSVHRSNVLSDCQSLCAIAKPS